VFPLYTNDYKVRLPGLRFHHGQIFDRPRGRVNAAPFDSGIGRSRELGHYRGRCYSKLLAPLVPLDCHAGRRPRPTGPPGPFYFGPLTEAKQAASILRGVAALGLEFVPVLGVEVVAIQMLQHVPHVMNVVAAAAQVGPALLDLS
jgi:hypothetical protein